MYDLSSLTMSDMTLCGRDLRSIASNTKSLEEVAQKNVQYLYENMVAEREQKALALARLFLLIPYKQLPINLQSFAKGILGKEPENSNMLCLTLLGTKGAKDAWGSRFTSEGHQAIPLASENFVREIPMISALIDQLGLELGDVLDRNILYDESKTYNVFHVPEVKNSPLVPAQESFVVPENIKSVLGFGGILPAGNLFVSILFSRVKISTKFNGITDQVLKQLTEL